MKILFLGANGLDTSRLRLAAELRDVQAELERAKERKAIEIRAELAVRPVDLSRVLLDDRPDVVHFSGHGVQLRVDTPRGERRPREFDKDDVVAAESAIVLETDEGKSTTVPPEALTGLFGILKSQRCIVLNACFSASQAQDIVQHVDCVIGMKRAIGDDSALVFSAGFYQALARGTSVKEAFELGKNLIVLSGLPDGDVPELYCRGGVDPHEVRLVVEGKRVVQAKSRSFPGKALGMLVLASLVAGFVIVQQSFWGPMSFSRGEPGKGTVIVVGPGGFSGEGNAVARKFCQAMDLTAYDNEPPVVCRVRGRRDDDEVLRGKTIEAGASVLVAVGKDGKGHVYPFGKVAGHDLFARGLPVVDLTREGALEALAPLVREWAKVADGAVEGAFDRRRLRCGQSVADASIGIAVSTLVLRRHASNCGPIEEDVVRLRPQCRDETCMILDGLEVKPLDTRADCDHLEHGRMRLLCTRERAFAACAKGTKQVAMHWLETTDSVQDTLYAITASELAACLIAYRDDVSAEAAVLEARADKGEPGCEAPACEVDSGQCKFCTDAMSERGRYWAIARDWRRAERDYEWAFRRSNHPAHLLGLVESRLHRFKEFEADELVRKTVDELKKLQNPTVEQSICAALLEWVATKREGKKTYIDAAEKALIKAYGALPEGASVYQKEAPDEVEKTLVCPRSAKECAVYDLLAVPKVAGTADALQKALRQSVLPEE